MEKLAKYGLRLFLVELIGFGLGFGLMRGIGVDKFEYETFFGLAFMIALLFLTPPSIAFMDEEEYYRLKWCGYCISTSIFSFLVIDQIPNMPTWIPVIPVTFATAFVICTIMLVSDIKVENKRQMRPWLYVVSLPFGIGPLLFFLFLRKKAGGTGAIPAA